MIEDVLIWAAIAAILIPFWSCIALLVWTIVITAPINWWRNRPPREERQYRSSLRWDSLLLMIAMGVGFLAWIYSPLILIKTTVLGELVFGEWYAVIICYFLPFWLWEKLVPRR